MGLKTAQNNFSECGLSSQPDRFWVGFFCLFLLFKRFEAAGRSPSSLPHTRLLHTLRLLSVVSRLQNQNPNLRPFLQPLILVTARFFPVVPKEESYRFFGSQGQKVGRNPSRGTGQATEVRSLPGQACSWAGRPAFCGAFLLRLCW